MAPAHEIRSAMKRGWKKEREQDGSVLGFSPKSLPLISCRRRACGDRFAGHQVGPGDPQGQRRHAAQGQGRRRRRRADGRTKGADPARPRQARRRVDAAQSRLQRQAKVRTTRFALNLKYASTNAQSKRHTRPAKRRSIGIRRKSVSHSLFSA